MFDPSIISGITSGLASAVARLAGPLQSAVGSQAQTLSSPEAQTPASPAAQTPASPEYESLALLLPDEIKLLLDSPLNQMGFPLEKNNIKDTGRQVRYYYRALVKGGYVAWLYLGNHALEDNRQALSWAWVGGDFANNGARGLFVLSDADRVAISFDKMAHQWASVYRLHVVKFFDAQFTQELTESENGSRQDLLKTYLGARFTPVPPSPRNEIAPKDKERVIDMLSVQATTSVAGAKMYVRNLVDSSNWPRKVKSQRADAATGDANIDARGLVEFAIGKKENTENQGYTIFGGLLAVLFNDVGASERKDIYAIITKYGLITDPEELKGLSSKIPNN